MSDAAPENTPDTPPDTPSDTPSGAPSEAPSEAPAEASAGVEAAPETASSKVPSAATAEPASEPRAVFVAAKLVMLVEPDSPFRGSVLAMSRTLAHVDVKPFSSVELGEEFMKDYRIQGLLLSVGEGAEPMEFLARLRRGECPCDADIPVVVMSPTCDALLAGQLKEYGVSRLLLEPFKLGDIAHTLEQLWEIKVDIPPQKPAPAPVVEAIEEEPSEAAEASKATEATESSNPASEGAEDPQAESA